MCRLKSGANDKAVTAYLSLGSNIGRREFNIIRAVQLLTAHDHIRLVSCSSLYETEPVGFTDQPAFLNAAIGIETTLSPQELLGYCQWVETCLGRVRTVRWGPRTLDVDLLTYGCQQVNSTVLTLPHPRLAERRFVLTPLAEIAGDSPVYNELTAGELLKRVKDSGRVVFFKNIVWPG